MGEDNDDLKCWIDHERKSVNFRFYSLFFWANVIFIFTAVSSILHIAKGNYYFAALFVSISFSNLYNAKRTLDNRTTLLDMLTDIEEDLLHKGE